MKTITICVCVLFSALLVSAQQQPPVDNSLNEKRVSLNEAAVALVDELSAEAGQIGAINTITVGPDGRTTGYNTDRSGFRRSFEESLGRAAVEGKDALLVGAGGAGRAAAFARRRSTSHATCAIITRARCSSPARTSAPARRASTRCGRCRTMASAS